MSLRTGIRRKEHPLPLVVFLHGSVATADAVRFSGLVDLIDKANLSAKRPGFILLARGGPLHLTFLSRLRFERQREKGNADPATSPVDAGVALALNHMIIEGYRHLPVVRLKWSRTMAAPLPINSKSDSGLRLPAGAAT